MRSLRSLTCLRSEAEHPMRPSLRAFLRVAMSATGTKPLAAWAARQALARWGAIGVRRRRLLGGIPPPGGPVGVPATFAGVGGGAGQGSGPTSRP